MSGTSSWSFPTRSSPTGKLPGASGFLPASQAAGREPIPQVGKGPGGPVGIVAGEGDPADLEQRVGFALTVLDAAELTQRFVGSVELEQHEAQVVGALVHEGRARVPREQLAKG